MIKSILIYLLIAVLSYLLGSFNSGVILSKKLVNEDVRTHGSGNAGTTNMFRNYGKGLAALTIIGDMIKVGISIFIAYVIIKWSGLSEYTNLLFGENTDICIKSFAGFFTVLGHIFPCYFGFKGGKGVATSGGMVFAIDWRIALILLAVFIIVVVLTKYVSLGSIVMAVLYPILIFLFHKSITATIISCIFMIVVIIAHRENIDRLIHHNEHKIYFNKKSKK